MKVKWKAVNTILTVDTTYQIKIGNFFYGNKHRYYDFGKQNDNLQALKYTTIFV